jgi:hypothetical protein
MDQSAGYVEHDPTEEPTDKEYEEEPKKHDNLP